MYKRIIFIITTIILISSMSSCESMENTYKEFTKDGEIVYIGKADSIEVRGGRNRIELSWLLLSDPKVSKYKVYWNNGEDSVSGSLVKTDQVDTVRLMFNDMEENHIQFDIFLLDNFENSSIRSSAIGRVYGDSYNRSLMNRTYTSKRKGGDLIIEWMGGEEDLLGVEVEYKNSLGEMIEKIIPGDITTDTLFNFPVGESLKYRTIFLPEPLALDTFYTDPIITTFN